MENLKGIAVVDKNGNVLDDKQYRNALKFRDFNHFVTDISGVMYEMSDEDNELWQKSLDICEKIYDDIAKRMLNGAGMYKARHAVCTDEICSVDPAYIPKHAKEN